jgi:hypothetical protein
MPPLDNWKLHYIVYKYTGIEKSGMGFSGNLHEENGIAAADKIGVILYLTRICSLYKTVGHAGHTIIPDSGTVPYGQPVPRVF